MRRCEAWLDATKAAGYRGKLMHDFRRTAATQLDQNKAPRDVAKAMVGRKNDIMFTRYVQTEDERLAEAAKASSRKNRGRAGSKRVAESQKADQNNSEVSQ